MAQEMQVQECVCLVTTITLTYQSACQIPLMSVKSQSLTVPQTFIRTLSHNSLSFFPELGKLGQYQSCACSITWFTWAVVTAEFEQAEASGNGAGKQNRGNLRKLTCLSPLNLLQTDTFLNSHTHNSLDFFTNYIFTMSYLKPTLRSSRFFSQTKR